MNGIEVSVQVLKLAAVIYGAVQAVKKSPWIEGILERLGGAWVPIALAVITAAVGGFVEFGADGRITAGEAFQIVMALVAAMGTHAALSTVEKKTISG